ncbi:ATP-dependent helicase [Leptolyngbya sp. 15MV]|nr:ATP-dependent helicase [Leptolyngbya sp. 15MV]
MRREDHVPDSAQRRIEALAGPARLNREDVDGRTRQPTGTKRLGQVLDVDHAAPGVVDEHRPDDDQAIYGFRGSDDRAFARFDSIWPNTTRVTLSANFRSRPAIVRLAAAIIGQARNRFDPTKVVVPGQRLWQNHETRGEGIEAIALAETSHDAGVIAATMLTERAADPRPWSSYAVIARSNAELQRIADALLLEGIPVRRARAASPMDDPGVQDLMRWVRLIVRGDLEAAATLLTRPPVNGPIMTIKSWHDEFRAQRRRRRLADRDDTAPPSDDTAWDFFDWLDARAPSLGERGPLAIRLGALARDLAARVALIPPSLGLATIAREADLVHADLLPGLERRGRIEHLAALMRFARERDRRLGPGLARFLDHFENLDDKDQRLETQENVGDAGMDDGDSSEDAVTFVTAHGAKGLEFDTVFIPNLRPQSFPATYRGTEAIPDGLLRPPTDPGPRDRFADEERRLFYVAVTRAMRRVVVLAKAKKSRGNSVDFFYEVMDQPNTVCRSGEDVLRAAAAVGVNISGSSMLDTPSDATPVERRRAVLWSARRSARASAADALELADRPGVTPEELAAITARLAEAARRLAITAAVDHSGHAPRWATDATAPKADRELAHRLESALSGRDVAYRGHPVFRPMPGPLRVSYSWIEDFSRCPRCFYMRRVIGWPEPAATAQTIGTLIHGVLERFARESRDAEADGQTPPDYVRLLSIAREFARQSAAEPDLLEQLNAQLDNFHKRLHNPSDEVVDVEFTIKFPYVLDGATHTIEVKIDRVDRLPAGGHRVVDYKTGNASDKLLRPKDDDLQLGIYALAIAHHQGCALPEEAVGEAQYWVLSTGEIGRLPFTEIRFDKVRSQIDRAIRAMLQGDFPRGASGYGHCWGLCEIAGD